MSYTDLISKINSAGVSGKVIIECAWNGISQSASAINGTNKNALSANGAVDYGYTRHGQKILVRPASGYSPIIQGIASGTGGSKYTFATGLNYIEWRGMTFDGMCMKIQTSATYPTPAIMAVKSCILQNGTIDSGIFWCVSSGLGSCRVLHIENTIEDNNRCGMLGAPNYFRRWNCVNTGHCDNDWNGIRGYAGYALNWRAYIWMAGNLLYSPSQTGYLTSGNHLDYMQCSTTAAAGNIKDHDFLIEFNVIYMNRPGNAGGPQGLFGDDGTATGTWDWLVHNNIIAIGAYWAMKPFDPNDNGEKWVVRNIFARKGHGPGYNSQTHPFAMTPPRRCKGKSSHGLRNRLSQGIRQYLRHDLCPDRRGQRRGFSEQLELRPAQIGGVRRQDAGRFHRKRNVEPVCRGFDVGIRHRRPRPTVRHGAKLDPRFLRPDQEFAGLRQRARPCRLHRP